MRKKKKMGGNVHQEDKTKLNATVTAAANSGVDIGDVDVTSVVPGVGATNLGKAEDQAAADGDVGVVSLAIRKATPANQSGTDGDYEPLQISAGRVWASSTITSLIPGVTATALGKAEDAVHASGDTGVMALAVRKATPANLSGTDGDYEPLQMNAGRLWASEENSAAIKTAVEIIDNQEDSITYLTYVCTTSDGVIVAAPAAGYFLRIHHLYAVNADDTDLEFNIQNGSAGTPYFPFYLAAFGGAVAQNLKRPWDLSQATALYYDYVAGTTPDGFIVVGYETVRA